ncbi:hypothetical protein [Acinetobacter phage P577]|uniref:hypothetical protein n=1 Tax=Acinetobacter phage YMC13/03/R2096 TaxID=1560342 RepID=UPI00052A2922|nr:hypothetical protein ACQ36_gp038 [Acinetobacter phage YMC13/03/R2096]AIW02895.1 hypothetical protein BPABA577_01610 [Acinetobacter phage YMC13/03/R2096]WNT46223.1 hypothetical protein [Acinetobacter phage P577]
MSQVFEEKVLTVLEDIRNKAAKDKLLMEISVLKYLLMENEGLTEPQAEEQILEMCKLGRKEFYQQYWELVRHISGEEIESLEEEN